MFSQRFRVLLRLKPSTLRSHTWEHPNVLVSEGFTEQQTRKIAVSLKDCAFSRMSAKNSDDKREHSLSHSHTSKRHGSTKYAADKETYLHMPKDEKRKVYKCGKDYITLDKIQRWPLYVQNRKGKYRNIGADKVQPKFEINDTLNQKVAIFRGDITKLEIDTIVNAANSSLAGGGGVDGAIHSAAGQKLLQTECKTLGGCKTGEAKITGGYKLPAKYVIHTVGPVGENEERLKSSYVSCLEIMKEKKLRTVAFPCISTGIYGYPNESACDTTLSTVRKWLEEGDNKDAIDLIIFCLFLPVDVGFYESKMLGYFPLPADIFGGDGDNGNNISTKDEKSKPQKPETPVDPSAAKAEVTESIGDVEMESQREEEEGSNTQPMASLDSEEECIQSVDPPDSITDAGGSDLEVKEGECLGSAGETPPVVKMHTATESELKERLQTEEGTDEGEQDFEEKAQARM